MRFYFLDLPCGLGLGEVGSVAMAFARDMYADVLKQSIPEMGPGQMGIASKLGLLIFFTCTYALSDIDEKTVVT